ncbi:nitrogen regulation protein NR(II) [Undibacterium arcticum]
MATRIFWSTGTLNSRVTGVLYLLLSIGFVLLALYYRRRFWWQLTSQIALDIVAISLLYIAGGGAKSGLAILYLFPLAGAAILTSLLMALLFVSVVALFMLAESSYQILNLGNDGLMLQAGLYGAAFFAAVLVINRLAASLIRQEELAGRRGQDLQIQQAINQLVIADMGDGILVVGPDSTVFASNPATEQMLGFSLRSERQVSKLTDIPSLAPIADAFFVWARRAADRRTTDADASTFVMVKPGDDVTQLGIAPPRAGRRELAAHVKLRFAKVEAAGLEHDRTVIFLQDVTEIENQAQQLKLASMGRLTASIAHEVRNPLAAISHAAALLDEDAQQPAQQRLLKIVADNVARVNQMIEDILRLSRKAQVHGAPIGLADFLAEIQTEFQDTHQLAPGMLQTEADPQYRVRFDPLHLREVLLNLLTNAIRYASGRPASIRMHAIVDSANRLELHVQDDGPSITSEVRAHLFEPFYTTSSKGTGLGLYLARELCLNNGAMLDYEFRSDTREFNTGFLPAHSSGRFVITFALPASA